MATTTVTVNGFVRAPGAPVVDGNIAVFDTITGESDWQNFMSQGADILRTELTRLAETMSQQSVRYGELNLPPVAVEQLNLRLPSPETVDANDFLEVAKLSQLQHALMTKQQEIAAMTEQLQNIDEVDLTQEEQALRTCSAFSPLNNTR